jgi:hypothetical protein
MFQEMSSFDELTHLIMRLKDAHPPKRCPIVGANESSLSRVDRSSMYFDQLFCGLFESMPKVGFGH